MPLLNCFCQPMLSPLILTDTRRIARRPEWCGVKARNLAVMARNGLLIPDFVVLTTVAHRKAIASERVLKIVSRALSSKRLVLAQKIVARSSAPFEDLPQFSLAGQLDSVLNISTETELLAAVERVWKSAAEDRLNHYFKQTHQPKLPKRVAVILQRQIDAELSGILFTSHPLSRDQLMLIELQKGGCDSIVSGRVTPFQLVVDKRLNKIIYSNASSELSDFIEKRGEELVQLGRAVEVLFGRPMDVEWGFGNGRFWIFQARPITALPSHDTIIVDRAGQQWSSYFFAERFDRPISQLAWSFLIPIILKNAFQQPLQYLGKDSLARNRPLIRRFSGRPFVRLEIFQALYSVVPPHLISEDKKTVLQLREGRHKWLGALIRALPSLSTRLLPDGQWLPFVNLRAWQKFETTVNCHLQMLIKDLDGADACRCLAVFMQTRTLSDQFLAIHRWSITFADILSHSLNLLLRFLGFTFSAAELSAGLPGNATVEADLALLTCDAGNPVARQRFLDAYGHRSASLDFAVPTWREKPELVFEHPGLDVGLNTIIKRINENKLRRKELLSIIKVSIEKKSLPSRILFQALCNFMLKWSAHFYLLRENQRDLWQKILYISRRSVLQIAEELQNRGQLEEAQDIFMLTLQELRAAVEGDLAAFTTAKRRKADIFYHEEDQDDARKFDSSKVWLGMGVSSGTADGPARVVLTYEEALSAQAGEIVIAPAADPAWTTIFSRIAGLILENGGLLSHASIVAREFRLPTVTNIPSATRIFRTGQRITLDGGAGIVTVHS